MAVRFEGGNDILTLVSTKEIIVVPVLQWKMEKTCNTNPLW